MNVVIADMYGSAGLRSGLRALLTDAERRAGRHDGCIRYTVAVSVADPDCYLVVSEWRDDAALEAHYASPEFQRFQFALHGLRPVASGPIARMGGSVALVEGMGAYRHTRAYALGPEAGEWFQQATVAIRARVPLELMNDVIQPFPTFSEVFLHALEELGAKVPATA